MNSLNEVCHRERLVPASRSIVTRRSRVVLYSHDTLGYGHLRRNLLLAGALRESAADPDVLLIAGMREAGAFELPPGVDCVSLPAYAKDADGNYGARDLRGGIDALCELRASVICAAVLAFDPDLMIVDNVPRGALYELDPVLKALRKSGRTRLILGLRDVIDEPAVTRRQWLRHRNFEALREFYSEIWIYGDPAIYDTATEYGLARLHSAQIHYTGYLDPKPRLASVAARASRDALVGDDRRPYVLCTVGGGRDGATICEAFAAAPLPAGHRGILVTGSQMPPEARRRLTESAARRSDLTLVEFVREPLALAAGASALVGMGGYNSVCEALSLGRPALIVPRVRPRREQIIRGERLARRGLIDLLHPESLTPAAIGAWLSGLNDKPFRLSAPIALDGLDRVRSLVDAALTVTRTPLRQVG